MKHRPGSWVCKPTNMPLTEDGKKVAIGLYDNGKGFSLHWIAWLLNSSEETVEEVVKCAANV